MTKHTLLIRSYQCVVALLGLLILLFFLSHGKDAIHIDSSLKRLAPEIANDTGVQQAIDMASSAVEKRFTLVVASRSREDTEDAAYALERLAAASETFEFIDPLAGTDNYLALIAQHRFQLLTPERSEQLATASDAELLALAKRRLYSLDSSAPLFSLWQDPFGFVGDFVVAGGGGKPLDQAIERPHGDGAMYYLPLMFRLRHDALDMDTQRALAGEIEHIKTTVVSTYPDVRFLHSGVIFFARDAAVKSKRDISVISTVSSLGIVSLLLLVFRALGPLLLPLASIAFGIALAFVGSHTLFGSVHILTIVFGAGLIGVVIDYALHFFYHQGDPRTRSNPRHLYRALTFSLLTSVIGYSALAFSGLESLQRVAIFSVIGLGGAWLIVAAVGPMAVSANFARRDRLLKFLLAQISRASHIVRPQAFFACAILILFGCAGFFIAGFNFSDDPSVFFQPDAELVAEEKTVSRLIADFEPGNYLILRGKTVADIYRLSDRLALDEAPATATPPLGIQRLLPSPAKQRYYYRQNSRLYGEQGLASQLLQTMGVDDAKRDAIARAYAAQREALLPVALMQALGNNAPPLWAELDGGIYSFVLIPKGFAIDKLVDAAAQHEDILYINTAAMATATIADQRRSALAMVLTALLLVAGLVLLRYRRVRYLNLVLVPTCAIALTLMILQMLAPAITLFHIMALFLVLGLGMDYVIFVAEIPENRHCTLQAVMLSAFTSLLSFGLLASSSLPVVQAFGLTVLIGNAINLLGACILAHHFTAINVATAKHKQRQPA